MLTASLKAFALSTLVVSPAHLVLRLRDGQALELPSASNTAVGYSRDTFRGPRVNVGTGFIPLVVPGRGAFDESGAHFISI